MKGIKLAEKISFVSLGPREKAPLSHIRPRLQDLGRKSEMVCGLIICVSQTVGQK